jgi:uncharacterized protein (DUF2267 family)
MRYDEFVARVAEYGGPPDRDRAEQATVATLELLGQRLAGREPSNLAAQLPQEMKEPLTRHVGDAESFDVDEFFRRLAEQEGPGCDPDQAREHARTVIKTLSSFVSAGELGDLQSQLPAGYAVLFQ